jgi:hypothetical protein
MASKPIGKTTIPAISSAVIREADCVDPVAVLIDPTDTNVLSDPIFVITRVCFCSESPEAKNWGYCVRLPFLHGHEARYSRVWSSCSTLGNKRRRKGQDRYQQKRNILRPADV